VAEFLLELFSEEIPARMQARAAQDLERLAREKLTEAGLHFERIASYVTPRRLTLVVDGLPEKQPDVTKETKGPKVGAPDKAVQGFLRAQGLSSLDEAERRETEKGTFYFAVRHIEGRPTVEVLADFVIDLLNGMGWPKSMRWSANAFRWVRPLHNILAILDGKVLGPDISIKHSTASSNFPLRFMGPFETAQFEHLGYISPTARTFGHRFLAPDPIRVTSFADYKDKLRNAYVILDPAERREVIRQRAEALAAAEGLRLKDDPALLDENAGLTEWPVPLLGTIDDAFMELPPEVLTTSMRSHQKYFATETPEGKLANRFVLVANIETPDDGAAIVAGNERVLRARLADAQFFWDQDRRTPLRDRVGDLGEVVFHAKLGTLHDKIDRIDGLAVAVAGHVEGADRDKVRSAALLAKADLTTGMVGEFPELQGVMGRYYALADGEAPEVAEAIAEHYSPLGPTDRCPAAPVSVAVALADKVDTLTGFFAIDEKPTGSKDPFALRRAALGIIRLIVENRLRLPLAEVFAEALRLQPEGARQALHDRAAKAGAESPERLLTGELLDFLAERLKVVLRDRGVRHDLIAAVFAVQRPGGGPEDDLVRLLARVEALRGFLESDDGANLLVAYRRAANIVRIEEKKDKTTYDGAVEPDLLQAPEEAALHDALDAAAETATAALRREDFTRAMAAMAELRKPVDSFFDRVTVNADDAALRQNRLRLLKRIDATLRQAADFARIEG